MAEYEASRPDGAVLVYALSGLGKSTLAAQDARVLDADRFLYSAVAQAFPALDERTALQAWRALCQRKPWTAGGADLALWARTRRRIMEPLAEAMLDERWRLVLTSLRHPPWHVSAYYGIERGRYLEHLSVAGRHADNSQSEAMNDRLDGYSPLVRLPPGRFLGDQEALTRVVDG